MSHMKAQISVLRDFFVQEETFVLLWTRAHSKKSGFDHGVGHPLLLLYDAKAPNCQKRKEFKGLGHYPSNTVLSSFYTMIKLQHLYNYLIFLPFLARY